MSISFLRRLSKYMLLSAACRRRAARPKARSYRPELLVLEDRCLPSTVLWNGNGHDGLWRTAANWVGGAVPGPADDAVIDDTSPAVTVTLAGNSPVSVRSLTDTKGFVLTGSLTVTAGPSSVSGAFTLAITGDLHVDGSTASLTATGQTTVLGANLFAVNGGHLGLLGATTVDATRVLGNSFEPIQANGFGSRVDLSGVTTWLGGGNATQGSSIIVAAANGGIIDLPQVTDISVGNTIFRATSGGQINLTGLTRFSGAIAPLFNFLTVIGSGSAIVAPALTSLTNVDLMLSGSGSLSLGQLASFQRGNITVESGGVLALPLTTIDQSGDPLFGETFKADGAGSRLDLSSVTTWRGAAPAAIGRRIAVQATNGGTVDLSQVDSISAGNSSFQALDGGQLNLTSLTSFTAPAGTGGVNTLEAHRGGAAVIAPALTSLTNVDLILAGTGALPVGGLSTFQHGNILVRKEFGDVGGVLVPPWTTIDESGFTGFSPTFQADGTGSRLDLSSVTTWRGAGSAANDTRLGVLATNGGTVDLSQVAGITAGNTSFQAVNPTSQINLAGLTNFTGAVAGPNSNILDARQGGTLTLSSGTTVVSNVLAHVDPTGTMTAGTLQLSGGSLLTGSGTLTADVINAGQIAPGSGGTAGRLTINGNYTQTATGVLTIDIGGLSAGSEYDQLVVSGAVSLDGTLTVNRRGGFVPQSGDSFAVLTFGSGSGVFAAIDGDGPLFTASYDPNDVTLVAN
jgi:fibronectin-binding autotransporter adhesin